jgi:hypothetical protein
MLALYQYNVEQVRDQCSPELVVSNSPMKIVLENIVDNVYFTIIYKPVAGVWKMHCPGRQSYKYASCKSTCVIYMMCRGVLTLESEENPSNKLATISSHVSPCNDRNSMQLTGRIFLYKNLMYNAMTQNMNQSMTLDMSDWHQPYLENPDQEFLAGLNQPEFSLENHTVNLKRFSYDEVKRIVDQTYNNNYYGPGTPKFNNYDNSSFHTILAIAVPLLGRLFGLLCLCICCCGGAKICQHWHQRTHNQDNPATILRMTPNPSLAGSSFQVNSSRRPPTGSTSRAIRVGSPDRSGRLLAASRNMGLWQKDMLLAN